MYNRSDQFAKSLLRDALSRASSPETEVEVVAATQRIDVYSVPDAARAAEREQMGLLGELSAYPSLFEPFRRTPSLARVRRCLCKQHTWHHELERRARAAAGAAADEDTETAVPFPALVVLGPGRPESVLDQYGCKEARPGLYHGVAGLLLRVVVLAELPRTRDTLLLRLLGSGRVMREALVDLTALPLGAWERSVATPLLIHFRLAIEEPAEEKEDDVSAEMQAWFEDYQRKLRDEGRKEGELRFLIRLLRARFGEVPPAAVARVEAAGVADLERWGERMLTAQTLSEVLDDPS